MSEAEKKVKERYPRAVCFHWDWRPFHVIFADHKQIGDAYCGTCTAAWQSALERMERCS